MKNNFGFIHNDPDTITLLDQSMVPKKAMQGSPWYQILSNRKYSNLFYYVGAFLAEREKIIEDGFAPDEGHEELDKKIKCE